MPVRLGELLLKENMVTPQQLQDALREQARTKIPTSKLNDVLEAAKENPEVLDDPVPVADVMRCLMYAHSYNDYQMAREAFARLPSGEKAASETGPVWPSRTASGAPSSTDQRRAVPSLSLMLPPF